MMLHNTKILNILAQALNGIFSRPFSYTYMKPNFEHGRKNGRELKH